MKKSANPVGTKINLPECSIHSKGIGSGGETTAYLSISKGKHPATKVGGKRSQKSAI
jgi:hypothetical protein